MAAFLDESKPWTLFQAVLLRVGVFLCGSLFLYVDVEPINLGGPCPIES